jgi:hypothetical protein
MDTSTSEVKLALYDLSKGMARNLSSRFLGPNHVIDIIPHTGILVFGKEYFFGGGGPGIGSDDPHNFRTSRGMQPIQIIPLGRTTVTKAQFDAWCHAQMNSGRYHGDSYDLLRNNCNNFSDAASKEGLKLSKGVPEWILSVPSRFMASPMGQIIRPMLENMQLTGGGGGGVPFAPTSSNATPGDTDYNPWAASPSTSKRPKVMVISTPILDTHNRPLVSDDTKTAALCATKLMNASTNDSDKAALESLHVALAQANKKKPSSEIIDAGCGVIYKYFENDDSANLTFTLMLLRLVVLHTPTTCSDKCVAWVRNQLTTDDKSRLLTTASRSMAWCVLSNAFGTHSDTTNLEKVCEAATGDITKEEKLEVRLAASAFLYNVSLIQSPLMSEEDVVPDLLVSLCCSSLEGLDVEEPDTTVKLRRLLCAARLVKSDVGINHAAKQLVVDTEFDVVVRALASSDDTTVAPLAAEFLALLES